MSLIICNRKASGECLSVLCAHAEPHERITFFDDGLPCGFFRCKDFEDCMITRSITSVRTVNCVPCDEKGQRIP